MNFAKEGNVSLLQNFFFARSLCYRRPSCGPVDGHAVPVAETADTNSESTASHPRAVRLTVPA